MITKTNKEPGEEWEKLKIQECVLKSSDTADENFNKKNNKIEIKQNY